MINPANELWSIIKIIPAFIACGLGFFVLLRSLQPRLSQPLFVMAMAATWHIITFALINTQLSQGTASFELLRINTLFAIIVNFSFWCFIQLFLNKPWATRFYSWFWATTGILATVSYLLYSKMGVGVSDNRLDVYYSDPLFMTFYFVISLILPLHGIISLGMAYCTAEPHKRESIRIMFIGIALALCLFIIPSLGILHGTMSQMTELWFGLGYVVIIFALSRSLLRSDELGIHGGYGNTFIRIFIGFITITIFALLYHQFSDSLPQNLSHTYRLAISALLLTIFIELIYLIRRSLLHILQTKKRYFEQKRHDLISNLSSCRSFDQFEEGLRQVLVEEVNYKAIHVIRSPELTPEQMKQFANAAGVVFRYGEPADSIAPIVREFPDWLFVIGLVHREKTIGLLVIDHHTESRRISREELSFIRELRLNVGMAYANVIAFEDLTQALRVKSSFLSMVSHELLTPLNIIIGLENQLSSEINSSSSSIIFDDLANTTYQIKDKITHILESTNDTDSTIDHESQPINIHQVIERIVMPFKKAAQRKGVHFQFVQDLGKSLRIMGNAKQIEKILRPILGNAIQYTESGEISVHAMIDNHSNEDILSISVTDTGVGIDPTVVDTIFDTFFQGDSSLSRSHYGLGLGLFIARKVTNTMNGTITVQSEPGKGSTFTVQIPVSYVEVGGETTYSEDLSSLHVLIAEDMKVNYILLKAILNQMGITNIEHAENGCEAVDKYQAASFNIILMDITMPIMDGVQATERIRQLEHKNGISSTPIIAVTANALPDDVELYLAKGMNGVVAKPISKELLESGIRDSITRQAIKAK